MNIRYQIEKNGKFFVCGGMYRVNSSESLNQYTPLVKKKLYKIYRLNVNYIERR